MNKNICLKNCFVNVEGTEEFDKTVEWGILGFEEDVLNFNDEVELLRLLVFYKYEV